MGHVSDAMSKSCLTCPEGGQHVSPPMLCSQGISPGHICKTLRLPSGLHLCFQTLNSHIYMLSLFS